MKYSQTIGFLSCIVLAFVCFMPWAVILSKNITVSGMSAEGTNFGNAGVMNIVFCAAMIIFFSIPKVWAKRTNIFIAALNIAWAFRNFLLVTTCDGGECPEKKAGIYLLIFLSVIILLMTFLPKISLQEK